MNNSSYTITKGEALVLVGPQGCGKTLLALQIAKQHGTVTEISAAELEDNRQLRELLDREYNTVVVDGLPARQETLSKIKTLLTSESVANRGPYSTPRMVKTPNFIFCTGSDQPIPGGDCNRRFRVVRVA